MKMDAIIKPARRQGLDLIRKEIPVLQTGEALIKIHKTAICGTDVHIYDWDEWSQNTIKTPIIIGHEFVGEIVELKEAYNNAFKVGDLVSAEGHIVCDRCRNCRAGRRHLCPNTQGIGVNRDGVFAEYAAIPISNLWLCDKSLDKKLYALFDPLGNATHTALTYNLIGEDVLITGAGPIGIMAAAICLHVGAKNVVLTDLSDFRLQLAKKVNPKIITVNTTNTQLKDIQLQLEMKEGFDVALEMSGSSSALNDIISNMISGGKIALLGVLNNKSTIDWNKVIFSSLNIKGIYGRKMFETWHLMTAMLKSGLDISQILTNEFYYNDFKKGFEIMKSGKSGKVILNWQ